MNQNNEQMNEGNNKYKNNQKKVGSRDQWWNEKMIEWLKSMQGTKVIEQMKEQRDNHTNDQEN